MPQEKKCPKCDQEMTALKGSSPKNKIYKCENPQCKIKQGGWLLVPDDIFEVRGPG